MKTLLAFNQDPNPYVKVIQQGLSAAGVTVERSTAPFWTGKGHEYDLIHFQWPETLFDWRVPSRIELEFLRLRLQELRGKVPLVYTYHNAVSHHQTSENQDILQELFKMLADSADVVIHLGETTAAAARRDPQWCRKKHVVIPHPVYEEHYADWLPYSKEQARKELGLPNDKQILLAFGNFRYPSEHQLIESSYPRIRSRQTLLYAPKWFRPQDVGFSPLQPLFCLRSLWKFYRAKRMGMRILANKTIPDLQVLQSFAAADLVVLPRPEDMNSGNLSMGFLFAKVVVGPRQGNIGYWLETSGNPVFDPSDPDDVARALQEGLDLSRTDKGEENKAYALKNWNTRLIGKAHADLYHELIKY